MNLTSERIFSNRTFLFVILLMTAAQLQAQEYNYREAIDRGTGVICLRSRYDPELSLENRKTISNLISTYNHIYTRFVNDHLWDYADRLSPGCLQGSAASVVTQLDCGCDFPGQPTRKVQTCGGNSNNHDRASGSNMCWLASLLSPESPGTYHCGWWTDQILSQFGEHYSALPRETARLCEFVDCEMPKEIADHAFVGMMCADGAILIYDAWLNCTGITWLSFRGTYNDPPAPTGINGGGYSGSTTGSVPTPAPLSSRLPQYSGSSGIMSSPSALNSTNPAVVPIVSPMPGMASRPPVY